uniref:CLIP domain-containing serine protease n=1 Tax=Anopheles epiroticus TaxID=199890 RepID=A0A182PNA6_9DIPT
MSPKAGRFLLLLVCVICAVTGASVALNPHDGCQTPDGKAGTCVYIRSCLPIRQLLLKKENMTPEDRSFVMKSNCGQQGRSVLVCCPLVRKLTGRFDAPVELPPPGECGKMLSDRIVGGEVTSIDAYPWLARIQYFKGKATEMPCQSPDMKDGICVTVAQCPLIQRLLNQPLLTSNVVRFLEASRCGALDGKVLVCCAAPQDVVPITTTAPRPVQTRPPAGTSPVGNRLSYDAQLQLLPGACGIHYTDRIIGGERTQLDEYPWTALIQHRRRT